jgi:hypothetical protein
VTSFAPSDASHTIRLATVAGCTHRHVRDDRARKAGGGRIIVCPGDQGDLSRHTLPRSKACDWFSTTDDEKVSQDS